MKRTSRIGPILQLEARHHVPLAEAEREQPEHWVLRLLRRELTLRSGIGHEESPGAAKGRLRVTAKTLVGIVPGAEPVRIGGELRERRIELSASGDGRSLRHHRTFVAGRFELTRTQNSFLE